jgi:hypothetical protein
MLTYDKARAISEVSKRVYHGYGYAAGYFEQTLVSMITIARIRGNHELANEFEERLNETLNILRETENANG